MDIKFLFGWAEEEGVDLPTKADGSINIPAAFALYDEWKKKGGEGKEKDGNGKFSENVSPSSITRKRTNSLTMTGTWKTCPVSFSWSARVRLSTEVGTIYEEGKAMFSYKTEIMENGACAALKGWVMPFSDGASLDEGLDSGKLNLSMCERRDALRPFTRVRISMYEGDSASGSPVEVIERVVMSDVVKMRRVGTE